MGCKVQERMLTCGHYFKCRDSGDEFDFKTVLVSWNMAWLVLRVSSSSLVALPGWQHSRLGVFGLPSKHWETPSFNSIGYGTGCLPTSHSSTEAGDTLFQLAGSENGIHVVAWYQLHSTTESGSTSASVDNTDNSCQWSKLLTGAKDTQLQFSVVALGIHVVTWYQLLLARWSRSIWTPVQTADTVCRRAYSQNLLGTNIFHRRRVNLRDAFTGSLWCR